MKKYLIADLSLLVVTIIWGTSFGIIKAMLDDGISPLTLMVYRPLFTTIILTPFLLRKFKKMTKKDVELGVKLGIIIFLGFLFQTIGADYTTAGKSAFLTTLNVIFVPMILFIATRKRLNISSIVAAIIALLGAAIMTIKKGEASGSFEHIGDLLTIIGSVFWALQIIKTSEYAKKTDIWLLVYFQFLVMTILSFITATAFSQSFVIDLKSSIAILYLVIFCTIIAFSVQAVATKYTSPVKASLIFTFEGFFGALFSYLIIKEAFSLRTILGGLTILLALIISELKLIDQLLKLLKKLINFIFRRRKWEKKDLKKI